MCKPFFTICILLLIIIGMVAADNTGYSITKHISSPGDTIGETSWTDTLLTNGGDLAVNKNFDFDSQNQKVSEYNIQTAKVLTYSSTEGAHLLGEESYTLSTAGTASSEAQDLLRCVYTTDDSLWLPAFCNTVQVKTTLMNINHAQISEQGSLRMVGDGTTPASLTYQVAISPDGKTPYAEGMVRTTFSGAIQEARDNSTNESASNQWRDSTEITGSISQFQKSYSYLSGLRL